MEFKNFAFKGYVTFYIALFSDGEGSIFKYEADFRSPITEEVVKSIAEYSAKIYNEKYGKKVTQIQFVSKEAYEEFCRKFPNSVDDCLTWEEDKVYLNGELIKEN